MLIKIPISKYSRSPIVKYSWGPGLIFIESRGLFKIEVHDAAQNSISQGAGECYLGSGLD